MSSANTKSPAKKNNKKAEEEKDLALNFAETVVLNMSRGKIFSPAEKETKQKSGDKKKTLGSSTKELSGIKLSLKKEDDFSTNYKDEVKRAEAEAIDAGETKSAYVKYLNPDNFIKEYYSEVAFDGDEEQQEEVANEVASRVVTVPALGITGSLRAISRWMSTHPFMCNNNASVRKTAARALVLYLNDAAVRKSPYVITVNNLEYRDDTNEVVVNSDINVNTQLYAKTNIDPNHLEKLSSSGRRVAEDYARRVKTYVDRIDDLRIPEPTNGHWWDIKLSNQVRSAIENFIHFDKKIDFDDLPKKSADDFASVPVTEKVIIHSNLLEICKKVGAVKSFAFSKIPKSVTHDDTPSGKSVVYDFCDMNDTAQVTDFMRMFTLKTEGAVSYTEAKKTSGKKSSSVEKNTIGYVLDRYFAEAKIDKDDSDGRVSDYSNTQYADLVNGKREIDVNKEFFTKTNTSGFRSVKLDSSKTHKVMFDNVKPIDKGTIEFLWDKYNDNNLDSDFWSTFINLLKATIKISATRASTKTDAVPESAMERTTKFFEIILKNATESDETVTDIMNDFSVTTSVKDESM